MRVTGSDRDWMNHCAARVVIVSSNTFVRLGLRRTFEAHAGIDVVGECAWGASARTLIEQERPDLIVKDVEVDLNQTEVLTALRQAAPLARIVLLTGWGESDGGRQAMEVGADVVIMMKCQPPSILLALIDGIARSGRTQKGRGPSVNVEGERENQSPHEQMVPISSPTVSSLTKRERELVALVGEGLSNRDIAERLYISETTVRHHLTAIFDKVGVSTRQKLLIFAYQNGLTELQLSA